MQKGRRTQMKNAPPVPGFLLDCEKSRPWDYESTVISANAYATKNNLPLPFPELIVTKLRKGDIVYARFTQARKEKGRKGRERQKKNKEENKNKKKRKMKRKRKKKKKKKKKRKRTR